MLKASDHEHILVVVMHHIVSDGWSMQVLVEEFVELYRARVQGRQATAAGAADPVRGLCGVAEPVAQGRGSGAAAGVLARAAGE